MILSSVATPTYAEQQLFKFSVNNTGGDGCCASYDGPAYDNAHYPAGGFATSSSGPGAISEAVGHTLGVDGGAVPSPYGDSFDGYGGVSLTSSTTSRTTTNALNFGGLTVHRNVSATHGPNLETTDITSAFAAEEVPNAIRFVETISNNTGAAISGYFQYQNNLGSDAATKFVTIDPNQRYLTSIQNNNPRSDAVFTAILGNNDYTRDQLVLKYADGDDNPDYSFPINVQPGETITIVTFAIITGSIDRTTDPTQANDIALGQQLAELITNGGNELSFDSPFFTGLTEDQLRTVINFAFPALSNATEIDTSREFFTENDDPAQAATITFNGGTLKLTGVTSLGQPITILITGGTIDTDGRILNLTGTITSAGKLTVADRGSGGGTVTVNGALDGGTVTVESSGVLRGTGTIGAPTEILGTLRPGNSPGTLTFTASVQQSAGSTLALDIDGTGTGNGAGNYSRVVITGAGSTYTIGSDVAIAPHLRGITGSATNTYTPSLGTKFAGVVEAEGGIVGGFSTLTQPSDGLAPGTRFDTVYGTNTIDLYVTPAAYSNLGAAGFGQTTNQASVGWALDRLRPAAGTRTSGETKVLFDALAPLDGAAIAAAETQLAGSGLLNTFNHGLTVNRVFGAMVQDRLDQVRAGGASIGTLAASALSGFELHTAGDGLQGGSRTARGIAGGGAPDRFGTWVRGVGVFSDNTGDGNDPGFRARAGGVAVGTDARVGEQFVIGLGASYTRSWVTGSSGSGNVEGSTYQVAGYGGWADGPWFADGTIGYAYNTYDTERRLSFGTLRRAARGETHGHDFNVALRGGYRFDAGGFAVTPDVGVRYDRLSRAGFTETGAGLLNLSFESETVNAVRSAVGGQVTRTFQTAGGLVVEPSVHLHWTQDLLDPNAKAGASLGGVPFKVETAKPGRTAGVMGVAVAAATSDSFRMFAQYDAEVRANQTDHVVTAGLRYSW